MFQFFEWIAQPIDIDGDQASTLLDAYRYAGVTANELLRSHKAKVADDLPAIRETIARLRQLPRPLTLQQHVDLSSFEDALANALDQQHLHQEPWILNTHFARALHF